MKRVEKDMESLEKNCTILKVSFYYLFDLSFKYFLLFSHSSSIFTSGDIVLMAHRYMLSNPAAGKPQIQNVIASIDMLKIYQEMSL